MRVRMRQAQRQMKGTKLQYIDQQPILFSDVAGVPGAKARSKPWNPSALKHLKLSNCAHHGAAILSVGFHLLRIDMSSTCSPVWH